MEREVHANKYSWLVSKCSKNMNLPGFAKAQGSNVLPRSTLLRPRVLCRALSQVDLEFHALPRSKPLLFSGTPQGHRLSCECILCPS